MKKILIFLNENMLKPIGGPSGYLFNLNKGIKKIENNYDDLVINFLPAINEKEQKKMRIKTKGIKFICKHFKKIAANLRCNYIYNDEGNKNIPNMNDYDIIHFHSTLDLYRCRKNLENYNGKVILTSHSPKPMHQEITDGFKVNEKKKKLYSDKIEIIDTFAFNRADYIIFPTEEAEECYFNTWDKYKEIKKNNINKYIYMPTGIIEAKINQNSKDIRKRFNIPEDAFVICYVGRHNEVKGYTMLKQIAEKVIDKHTYFLIAGKEEPFKGLNNDHWIEVGWTDRPYEIINAANMFVLPNKETYFDIVLLEVMSLGKAIMLTNTGGNKYFKKYDESGLFYYEYDDIEKAQRIIEELKVKDTKEIGLKNKEIFKKEFSEIKFAQRYFEILQKL